MKKIWLLLSLNLLIFSAKSQFVSKPLNFPSSDFIPAFLSIIDDNAAWLGVDHEIIMTSSWWPYPYSVRTTDGGNTWKFDSIPAPGNIAVLEIAGCDTNTAYYSLTDNYSSFSIWKTSDGGTSWTKKTTTQFSGGYLDFIYAFTPTELIAVGDPVGGGFEVELSHDGGDSWTRVPNSNIPNYLANEYSNILVHSAIGDTIWFSTSRGRCFRSVNRGLNWTVSSVLSTANILADVKFCSGNNGIYYSWGGGNGTIYKSTNGGSTWQQAQVPGNLNIYQADPVEGFPNGYIFTATTATSGIMNVYFTPDLFTTVVPVQMGIGTSGFLKFNNTTTGWLSGPGTAGNNIYKYSGLLTQIRNDEVATDKITVFPNPADQNALVKLPQDAANKACSVTIYSITGQQLEQSITNPGQTWLSLQAARYPSGSYFIEVSDHNGLRAQQHLVIQH